MSLRNISALSIAIVMIGCVEPVSPGPAKVSTPGGKNDTSDVAANPAVVSDLIEIRIEGSSTVYPVAQAMAEEFRTRNDTVKFSVKGNGTGNGYKAFVADESEVWTASRPVADKEKDELKKKSIEYVQLTIAIDGLSVVVHKDNDWCKSLTVAQLKKIWTPEDPAKTWKDVNPEWPDKPLKLYGPGQESGTFDYFTEVVNGKAKVSRGDYTPSEADNVLVDGVAGDKYALGYFGFAYYVENKDRLKVVPIAKADGDEAVEPTVATIESGKYSPLSRPLFIIVNKKTLAEKPKVAAFVQYFLSDEGQQVVTKRKYIRLSKDLMAKSQDDLKSVMPEAKPEAK